ncbi:nuclear polyadenylated RNA-binding protein 3-like [Papaver somniferum]|uniref:nuclear polyadenylated RNA-binding protein 3-like n=1 Tax=Papaver somniferum TaxID=3469 RepID=UPI000E6F9335|nr:nuclear polyadenylated RNA-binding protein 3-like [Papaver somniferum]
MVVWYTCCIGLLNTNSMTPSNEQGFPRFLRWIIGDINNTIEKDINEAMKKMQPGWVKACSDEQQQIMEEYRKNRQENSRDALKEKLYKTIQQRDEALEKLSDLKVKHLKLEEEEGEKGEISGKVDDVDDSDDDDDDSDDDEEDEKGKRSVKAGDVDGSDKEQEEEGNEETNITTNAVKSEYATNSTMRLTVETAN